MHENSEKPGAPRPRLKIDFADFQQALEGIVTMDGEPVEHFLDTETGEIFPLFPEGEDFDELTARLEAGPPERYRLIERLESHENFEIMEEFAMSLPTSKLKAQLLEALSRKKPFRRFKDTLLMDLHVREKWFRFNEDALEQQMRDWLRNEGTEAQIVRPRR